MAVYSLLNSVFQEANVTDTDISKFGQNCQISIQYQCLGMVFFLLNNRLPGTTSKPLSFHFDGVKFWKFYSKYSKDVHFPEVMDKYGESDKGILR